MSCKIEIGTTSRFIDRQALTTDDDLTAAHTAAQDTVGTWCGESWREPLWQGHKNDRKDGMLWGKWREPRLVPGLSIALSCEGSVQGSERYST